MTTANKYSDDWIFIVKVYLQDYLRDHKASDKYDCNSLVIILEQWINKHVYKDHYPYLLWFALRELLLTKFDYIPEFSDVVNTVLTNRNEFMNAWPNHTAIVDQVGHELTVDDVKEMIICNKYNFNKAINNVIDVAKELFNIYAKLEKKDQIIFGDDFPHNICGDIFSRSNYNNNKILKSHYHCHVSSQIIELREYLQKCISKNAVCESDECEYCIELSDYIRAYLLNIHSNNFRALCYSMWYTVRMMFMNATKGCVFKHDINNLKTVVKIYHIDLSKCTDCNIDSVDYKFYAKYCSDCTDDYKHIYHNIMFIQQRLCDDIYRVDKDNILDQIGCIQYVPLDLN